MRVSKSEDYALALVSALAQQKSRRFLALSAFANQSGLPFSALKRVARKLVGSKLLKVKEGRGGGYQLARPLAQLSAGDVLAAFSSWPLTVACSFKSHACADYADCAARKTWSAVNRKLAASLAKVKLAEVINLKHAHVKN